METVALILIFLIGLGTVVYLVATMLRAIRDEKKRAGITKTWRNFGLSIALAILFFTSWMGHGVAEWRVYAEEQRTHGEPTEVTGYIDRFAQSTFENWQSEFLQLFSFVVLTSLLIHKGSPESKDSDEEMRASLKRIEQRLDEMKG